MTAAEPATRGTPRVAIIDRAIRGTLAGLSRLYGAVLALFSPRRPTMPPEMFPWIKSLEDHWREIQHEFLHEMERSTIPALGDVAPGEERLAGGQWKVYVFRLFSHDLESNWRRCPKTERLVRNIPGMTSAFFSILEPGKHIPAHRGIYSGVLRYHLGLSVPTPSGSARMRLDRTVHHWEEGKSLLFDDTFEHEVWNDSPHLRAILLMDIKRPLPIPIRWMNDAVYAVLSLWVIPRMYREDRAIVGDR
jgi:beta-hydroxylase